MRPVRVIATAVIGVVLLVCSQPSRASDGTVADQAPYWATEVFTSGSNRYHTFRIPSLIVAPDGSLLAFAEGRRSGRGDSGDIDLVMRRSRNGGKSWGPLTVVWDDGPNTCGNPCPVVDRTTGRIILVMTWNDGRDTEGAIMAGRSRDTRRVFVTVSNDSGQTWSSPREITSTTKKPHWRWYATGPGVGIQLERGPHRGRLVIPCDHSDHSDEQHPYRSHVILSDDGGKTWRIGGVAGPKTNESQVVELTDGRLLLNMRSYHGLNRRAIAYSDDGGESWSAVRLDDELIEPVCQASLIRFSAADRDDRNRLLFSNPASTRRERMTVRLSYDEGQTWPIARVVYEGPAAYSCLTRLPDDRIGLLYERDDYARIMFASFTLDWLTEGRDRIVRLAEQEARGRGPRLARYSAVRVWTAGWSRMAAARGIGRMHGIRAQAVWLRNCP